MFSDNIFIIDFSRSRSKSNEHGSYYHNKSYVNIYIYIIVK